MEHDRTLHDLGFRRRSRKKDRSKKNNGKKPPIQPPTSTTLEELANRIYNELRYPPPDAPADTDIASSGHDGALLEKGEEGFTHYLTGKWRTGYPRVEEG